MEEKVKLVFELDKEAIIATSFLMGVELTQERWENMTKEPIVFSTRKLDKNDMTHLQMAFSLLVIKEVVGKE